MRTYGVNQVFRFVEGIWLHRKSRQIREKKNSEKTYFTSYVRNMFCNILYKLTMEFAKVFIHKISKLSDLHKLPKREKVFKEAIFFSFGK